MSQQTDSELLSQFRSSRSHQAFSTLVKRHTPLVYGVAFRITHNHHDAQDISQAVFSRLIKNHKRAINLKSLSSWLHTNTSRLALNHLRNQKTRLKKERLAVQQNQTASSSENKNVEFWQNIDELIKKLPEKYRLPIILYHLQEIPIKSISKKLQINESTLKTHLERGRSLLKKSLLKRGLSTTTTITTLFSSKIEATELSPKNLNSLTNQIQQRTHELITKTSSNSSLTELAHTLKITNLAPIIMKKQTLLIPLFLAGGLFTNKILSKDDQSNSTQMTQIPPKDQIASPLRSQPRSAKTKITDVQDNKISSSIVQVMHTKEEDRLQAIRDQLKLNLRDTTYQTALDQLGFQKNPNLLFNLILFNCLLDQPETLEQWYEKAYGTTDKQWIGPIIVERFALEIDQTRALEYAYNNFEKKYIDWILKLQKNALKSLYPNANLFPSLKDHLYQAPPSPQAFKQKISELTNLVKNLNPDSTKIFWKYGHDYKLWNKHITMTFLDLLKINPEEAANEAVKITKTITQNSSKIDRLIETITHKWATQDPNSALEWALNLDDDKIRATALAKIAPAWTLANQKPFDLNLLPQHLHESVTTQIIKNQTYIDPKKAAELVMSKIDSPETKTHIHNVIEIWALGSPEEAREWVESQTRSQTKDAAILALVDSITSNLKTDPLPLSSLLSHFQDSEQEQQAAYKIISDTWQYDYKIAIQLASQYPQFSTLDTINWSHRVSETNSPETRKAFLEYIEKSAMNDRQVVVDQFQRPGQEYKESIIVNLGTVIRDITVDPENSPFAEALIGDPTNTDLQLLPKFEAD